MSKRKNLLLAKKAQTQVGDHGPLPPTWVATLLDQLLAALERIHAEGLVHRDVKPANLLLDATGTEPDAAYRSMDPQLQEALTVGRPIAGA